MNEVVSIKEVDKLSQERQQYFVRCQLTKLIGWIIFQMILLKKIGFSNIYNEWIDSLEKLDARILHGVCHKREIHAEIKKLYDDILTYLREPAISYDYDPNIAFECSDEGKIISSPFKLHLSSQKTFHRHVKAKECIAEIEKAVKEVDQLKEVYSQGVISLQP